MTQREIDERLEGLYGDIDWPSQSGILHVAAICASGRHVIIPGVHAPKSETDRFVLGFARARADAILATGAILRAEPGLRHDFAESRDESRGFAIWRHRVLGREMPPELILLSATGDFPIDHPAVLAARAGFVWTTGAGAARLGPRVGNLEVRRGDPSAEGVRAAIALAREERGARTIVLEAGPAVSASLYVADAAHVAAQQTAQAPSEIGCDELLLSNYEGRLDPRATGPVFVSEEATTRRFPAAPHRCRLEETSGDWVFERYRRR